MDLDKLKYPIGKFQKPGVINQAVIGNWIQSIESLGSKISNISSKLGEEDLEKVYRPGGWTIRQVIHHIVDSHINAYLRFKWALTESNPKIKAYNEVAWAEQFDAKMGPIESSLMLLNGLHSRWAYSLKNLKHEEFQKSYFHPNDNETVLISEFIGRYAWHGEHHLAHIQQALDNEF